MKIELVMMRVGGGGEEEDDTVFGCYLWLMLIWFTTSFPLPGLNSDHYKLIY